MKLGELLVKVAEESKKRVTFIASADQGHAHDKNGPYGYDPNSKKFDDFIISIIKENQLERLLDLSSDFIESAKPDSPWQLAILIGILRHLKFKSKIFQHIR